MWIKIGYFALEHCFSNVFQRILSPKNVALKKGCMYLYTCVSVFVCVYLFVWSTCLGNNVYKFRRREAIKVNSNKEENKS